jgi:8-oxo-dGTP pyrophosphatase MutT (NUDIX family)
MVQEAKSAVRGLWNWPAGHLEEDETFQQAAIREVREETGFDVEIGKEIGEWPGDNDPNKRK